MAEMTRQGHTQPGLSALVQAMAPSPTIAASARAKALARQGKPVLELTVGEPDFDTPEHVKEAAYRAIRDGKTKYTPSGGIIELKEAVAHKLHRENGVQYDPASEVCICIGGKQALYNLMVALLNPGDEVLVPVPTWATFSDQVALVGGVPVHVPLGPDHKLRMSDLVGHVTPRTRAVIVNSPSNPTGVVMDPEEVRAVTRFAIEHGIYVITDDTYEHFLYDGAVHQFAAADVPGARDWVLAVNTVSKTYAMTGWRIGFASNPVLAPVFTRWVTNTESCASHPSQWAAVEALNGSQDCVHDMVAEFDARRKMFVTGLRNAGYECPMPEGAFYAYPRIPAGTAGEPGDSNAYALRLLDEAYISCVAGAAFFDGSGTLRMSYAASRAVLQEVLDRLATFGR
ncbi:MAG: pyridoxal phosphate-dependent aminotransferase [Proteobacteria bacterium]|nr:pyridoxal phosphate-dependent aminotransferase [Pseudomonadota bacterium]